MFMYICKNACTCAYICTYAITQNALYVYVHSCKSTYAIMQTYLCTYATVQKALWMYECMYVCMHACMYVWMYACMYAYRAPATSPQTRCTYPDEQAAHPSAANTRLPYTKFSKHQCPRTPYCAKALKKKKGTTMERTFENVACAKARGVFRRPSGSHRARTSALISPRCRTFLKVSTHGQVL